MRFMSILVYAFVIFSSAGPVRAADPAPASSSKDSTKNLMREFLSHMTALKKFLVSEEKFLDPKNGPEISSHLKQFALAAKQTSHEPMLSSENFKFSRQVLENHISETERVFNLGNKSYARWMMNSTISVCMSCHTQLPAQGRAFEEFGNIKSYTSAFDQAEFLFATRSFEKSLEIYDRIITQFRQGSADIEQLETSLARQITYYARIKRDPQGALLRLRTYLKNKSLPDSARLNINSWIQQFEKWGQRKGFEPSTATEKQVIEFAEKNLKPEVLVGMTASNPNAVTYLHVSGLLYEYLQTHSQSKIVPQVLYWLSICERSINNTFLYSLANVYLRECIVKYPADPIAAKCFKEYESETILGYTGSSGTHLPAEVREDLNQLKKLVETGGKVKLKSY